MRNVPRGTPAALFIFTIMENLTKHFTLEELTESRNASVLGIKNEPTKQHKDNLKALAVHLLEPLREMWGGAIVVSSGYRSQELNEATPGASKTSQHCKGEAADIRPLDGRKKELFEMIKQSGLPFDQLINEYPDKNGVPSWIHVSFTISRKNRGQVLTLGGNKK